MRVRTSLRKAGSKLRGSFGGVERGVTTEMRDTEMIVKRMRKRIVCG